MASRCLQLLLVAVLSCSFFFLVRRPTEMKIQNLKSFDPRVLVRTGAFLQDPQDHNSQCEPVGPKQAHRPPSRHQLLRFQSPIPRKSGEIDDQDFCPPAGPGRRATAILIPIGQGLEPWETDDSRSRTFFLRKEDGGTDPKKSDIGFLPFRSMSADEARLARPPRIETNMTDRHPCPVYYVPASPLFSPIPPLKNLADGARDPHNAFDAMLKRIRDFGSSLAPPKLFGTSCNTHKHSQSELALWERRGYSEFMFGFATTPTRALDFIPRWSEWLPSSVPPAGDDPADKWRATNAKSQPLRRLTASAVVLIPPKEELDQAWEVESAARGAGLDITLKELTADRFERRYMSLVQEMWKEAQTRERLGAPIVQWFTLADDDTYFLSLDSVARMLSKYNPVEAHFIGGQSESENANKAFGNIAFGGAGIFLSRGLIQQMNEPGTFDSCVSLFGKEFGGDGMITKCAAMVMHRDVQQVVTRETTLHQLDIRDEGHGIFQAGWRFTSIHHWRSWFQLQPRAHPHTLKNPATLASLLGSAARAVGPENWTRRYVWGLPPPDTNGGVSKTPSVVLSLGYSITVHGAGILKSPDLDQVEMTFALSKLTSSTRPAFLETKQRRTYYLYDLHTGYSNADQTDLNLQPDVAIMSHINQEGEVIDLVWDGRTRTSKSLTDTAYDDIGLGKN
ncbi:hypothetical protein Pst134EA_020772 [Puccinia striiformis f. sp. tritici]|uniref:Glycosyltransferase family 31 protein n=2 Tax=Puccinia striiformis f. sp. tritici TaxID=168172 RepID=A0A0L0VKG0_9BASI|nr:hypothetical protein Pst134EA_020772 [Puccinia striiformis f. sp. tritici]KAH9456862.1 hypothetical protein Pst134EA_020772 [Puccinia striiformis f. sp. tritici]KAI9620278.1 hypothetical protein H4Q26_013848 [Puccinia striiformis f. sp. tritici PST-130]KNE99763.1 hypothetical protein PSTG_07050 [Puccinia striiformis f. sp. tritici PST-78]